MSMEVSYLGEDNLTAYIDRGIDAFIAIDRLPHGQPRLSRQVRSKAKRTASVESEQFSQRSRGS